MSHRWLWMAVLFLGCGTEHLCAQERYYMLVFSYQRFPRNPNYAHTFATFVKSTPDAGIIDAQTISWLPKEFPIRVQALHPQEGRNYGLHETIRIATEGRERVSLWGPYEIEPELYRRAINQVQLLESGKVRYKANDGLFRSDNVSNCIHAVSVLAEGYRLRVFSPGWGDTASHFVLEKLMAWVVDRNKTHDWVATALGLDAYPIAYRKTCDRPLLKPVTGLHLFLDDCLPEPTYGPPAVRGLRGK